MDMFLFHLDQTQSIGAAPLQPWQLRRLEERRFVEKAKAQAEALTPSQISQAMSPVMLKKAWKRKGPGLTPSKIKEVMSPLWLKSTWNSAGEDSAKSLATAVVSPAGSNAAALSYDQIA